MKRQPIRRFMLLLSFLLFPITLYYFSPYLIIMGGFAGVITGSCIVFASLFLFSLVFGRAFCSWVCPAGGLQEGCRQVVNKRMVQRKLNWLKYFLWAPWLLGILAAFASAGGVKSLDFFYQTDHGVSASGLPGWITYFGIVALIVVLALTLGRRGMCHSICWMAPFMVLGTLIKNKLHLPSYRLQADPSSCVNCGLCTKNCPMSLEVNKMVAVNQMDNSECILCGECADGCPKQAIKLNFSSKKIKPDCMDLQSGKSPAAG